MLWGTYHQDIIELQNQFDNTNYANISGLGFEELCQGAQNIATTLSGSPHALIKASIMDYILSNVKISIFPKDWFGIKIDVMKVSHSYDAGKRYHTPMQPICNQWKNEMKERFCPKYSSERIEMAKANGLYIMYPDFDHSTPNWENALSRGFIGLLTNVEDTWNMKKQIGFLDEEQEVYYQSVTSMLKSMIAFIHRVADRVKQHLDENEKMPYLYNALVKIAAGAPETVYEVMLFQYLYWLVQENVELTRVRTLGGVDQIYYPYYKADLKAGRFNNEQIAELFKYFFNQFYSMHVMYQQPVYLGGMDEFGNDITNELSYIIINAYDEMCTTNPKMQIRVSPQTPSNFLKRVLDCIRKGNSSISLINDDVAIKALMKVGATLSEARTYLVSGCWDYAIKDHETKTIPMRLTLPKALELCMHNGIDPRTGYVMGFDVGNCEDYDTFEDFYNAYKKEIRLLIEDMIDVSREFEPYLSFINPTLLYSSTRPESVDLGRDAYQDGSKYNNTVINPQGLATVIDSLAAIKKYVYDQKRLTLSHFRDILDCNWIDNEDLQQDILQDEDKYGNESDLADELAVDFTRFLGSCINNVPNARGGVYKTGLISIDFHVRHGKFVGATPDGRNAWSAISKNVGPTIGMDRHGLTACINSITKIDFSDFSHAAMMDFILHPSTVSGADGLNAMLGIVRTFMKKGGHSLQFNVFDPQTLIEAQKHPEQYQTLQVRVCGWNVYFVNLSRWEQDLFIAQAKHVAAGL